MILSYLKKTCVAIILIVFATIPTISGEKSYNSNSLENINGINAINKRKSTDLNLMIKFIGLRCSENIVGKIEKFKELSGLVASRKYPVFYSIEDSLNKESVYVFLKNGTLVGCIIFVTYSKTSLIN